MASRGHGLSGLLGETRRVVEDAFSGSSVGVPITTIAAMIIVVASTTTLLDNIGSCIDADVLLIAISPARHSDGRVLMTQETALRPLHRRVAGEYLGESRWGLNINGGSAYRERHGVQGRL